MEADARPVRDPRLGGDAATDAGRTRASALYLLAGALADGDSARGGAGGGRDPGMARARLQPPRAESPSCRTEDRGRRLAWRSAGASRRWAVHRGGSRELRSRTRHPAGGHQREPRPGTHRLPLLAGGRAGADGSRRNGVPGACPALWHLPACGKLSCTRPNLRAAAQAIALRRLVPPTPCANVETRGRVRASAERARPRGCPIAGPGRPSPGRLLWNVRHASVVVSDTRTGKSDARATAPLQRSDDMRDSLVTRTARCLTPKVASGGHVSTMNTR
jgi:hypothetical protein